MGPWLIEVSERGELERYLGEPAPGRVMMVVRGDSPRVRELLPNALDASKLAAGRQVLWLRNADLLETLALEEVFGRDPRLVAVAMATNRTPTAWVYDDQIAVEDFAFAFAKAERA